MRKHATRERKIERSDIKEHSDRSKNRKTTEASSSDSLIQSRKEQEETKKQIKFLFEENEDSED